MKNFNPDYTPGFATDVSTDQYPVGLSEEVIRSISFEKLEPEWMLESRLKAYKHLLTLTPPTWSNLRLPTIDLNSISYFAKPTKKYNSIEEVPQEILDTFEKLGIPLHERAKLAGVAVDAVFDSVSIGTTFQETLKEAGIIFCSISEALHSHSELVKEHFGRVVPYLDNYYACLNAAVFSDGTFVYIPKGVIAPLELSTYFRINAENLGQFERTLIIADDNSYVSYIEGCSAPRRSEQQLHAAVVELIAGSGAEIKYSTVQNWYPGDENGIGGILNYVTKRGLCSGDDSKITWTQVETGSAITWKYPSCILRGNRSVGEFYSIAVTNNHQQADTGTKMVHIGEGTRSTIISKGISLGHSTNTYRGLVRIANKAQKSRNFTKCDSLVMHEGTALTVPYIEQYNQSSIVEHEASTSKISEDQLYYLQSRGLSQEDATNLIVTGFCKEIFQKLPLEFAAEAKKLIEYSLSLKYQG